MEAIVFIGIQASGKSSFFKERFADTHVRINMDMLKTRNRERLLLEACLKAKQPFVIDKTNPKVEQRSHYIQLAREHSFRVIGYFFSSRIEECKRRNATRTQVVPLNGLLGTYGQLVLPSKNEGFDALYFVKIGARGFEVEEWKDEI